MNSCALRNLFGLLLSLSACCWACADRVETDLSGPGWRLLHDKDAKWENDELFLPPVQLSKLPTNPPTGGWAALTNSDGMAVSVPGTAEEYLGDGGGTSTDVKGVTWWYRELTVPAGESRRITLQFESIRHRAEIYIDGKLVGYDIVGNSPFDVDLSELQLAGKTVQLAVRITDPGGNFDWIDFSQFKWGRYTFPMSHGFGGITGGVKLVITEQVSISDLYIQNTPAMPDVNVLVTLQNSTTSAVRQDLQIEIFDGQRVVAAAQRAQLEVPPGETKIRIPVSVDNAVLWDTDNPKLYTARATLSVNEGVTDQVQKRFGFRWFTADGIGADAVFRLNGKRVFLTTAISWGFFPINGMYATPELAEKQIRAAKSLGMNMLNFHRAIGSPVILDKADELGLLYFEEPGGYVSGGREAFGQAISREKLLRMVKRDRSHPSLVIYNMINEQWNEFGADKDDALFAIHQEDLRRAHEIDPSRIMTYTSAWTDPGKEQRAKLHVRPFDEKPYFIGWYDNHRATGPETWQAHDYKSPTQHVGHHTTRDEIIYRGEEGAISAPPRLELIHAELQKLPRPGWDGKVYADWYNQFVSFIDRKGLRETFPTVDALTCAMGEVSLEHQGRRIQAHRINNLVDGYAINGWEAEVIENHSGIVDCFRNPKADPAVIGRYLSPLYVAVMPRSQVLHAGSPLLVDLYAVNEKDVKGSHVLSITATDGNGQPVFEQKLNVTLTGGETFGQLLAEAVQIPTNGGTPGMWTLSAALTDAGEKAIAAGNDKVLIVDWKSDRLTGNGAVYERTTRVREFLATQKGLQVPAYRDDMGKLDWVLVTVPSIADPELIPTAALRDSAGQAAGLTASFFEGQAFGQQVHQRTDEKVDLDIASGGTPDPNVGMTQNYSVRWEGSIIPPHTGPYTFAAGGDDGVRLWIDGKLLVEDWGIHQYREKVSAPIQLEAGKPVAVKLEFFQAGGGAKCTLKWIAPSKAEVDHDKLFQRATQDGTTILFLDRPATWLDQVSKHTNVETEGTFNIGMNWLGGQFFVKKHPLVDGLPTDCAMNWPYQRIVRNGPTRLGMRIEGEELIAGAYQSWPMSLGTAIGVVNCGKGRIVLSSLDICGALEDPDPTAEVARKMLCNYIRFSTDQAQK